MHVAVGERRSVVEHEQRRVASRSQNLLIELLLFPTRKHLRFPLRQIRLHREVGPGKIQGLFVIDLAHFPRQKRAKVSCTPGCVNGCPPIVAT